jgi:hypothetical protein
MTEITKTGWLVCGLVLPIGALAAAADAPRQKIADDKQALAPLQAYVGEWRGVGQRRRGSSRGAWREQSQWSWRFDEGRAELVADVTGGKYFSWLRLQAGDKPGQFLLLATPIAIPTQEKDHAAVRRFVGTRTDGMLVLTAEKAAEGQPARISMRLVAGGDRMVVLYQKQLGDDRYARLGEVGATRKGSSFAKASSGGPECIVTGGLGTIAVEYQGKKYFVCCGGCRDLFDEDPAGVLQEYRQRKADQRANPRDK